MNAVEWQKERIIRAAIMAKRALDRGDTGQVDAWVGQFKREVTRLNEIDPAGRKFESDFLNNPMARMEGEG